MAPNTALSSLSSRKDAISDPYLVHPLLRGGGSDDSDSGNEADDERDDSQDDPDSDDERSDSSTGAPPSDPYDHYNSSDADERRDSHKGYQADSSECSD